MGMFPLEDMAEFNSKMTEREAIMPSPEFHEEDLYDVSAAKTTAIQKAKDDLDDRSISILGSVKNAWVNDTLTGAVITKAIESGIGEYDPEFNTYAQKDFIPRDDMEESSIALSQNKEHYAAIRDRLLERREYHLDMESVGWGGALAFGAAAEIGNITNYLIPGGAVFNKMKGLRKFVAAGAFGASVNLLETAGIDAMYNDRTLTEYIATAALGAGMSAAFVNVGHATKSPKAVTEQGTRIKEATEGFASKHTQENLKEAPGKDSVGAARLTIDKEVLDPEIRTRMQNDYLDPDDDLAVQTFIDVQEGNIPKQEPLIETKIGLGSQGYSTQTTENALLRKAGYDLVEKPETALDKPDKHTASLEISVEEKRLSAVYGRGVMDIWARFTKTDPELTDNFGKYAFRKMHTGDTLDDVSTEGNKLLQEWVDLRNGEWERIVKKGYAAGVDEFQDIEQALKHTTRQYDTPGMHELGRTHSEDAMVDLFKKSLLGDGGAEKLYQKYVDKAVKKAEEYNLKVSEENVDVLTASQKKIDKIHEDIRVAKVELDKVANKISKKGLQLEGKLERLQSKLYNTEVKSGKHWGDFVKKGYSVDAVALSMAKQSWRRFTRRALSPTRDANMLNTGNQSLMRDIIITSDIDTHLKDAMLHVLGNAGRDIKGDITKARMHIDMNAEIVSPVTGETVSMSDMFMNDVGAGEYMHMRYYIGRNAMAAQGPQYKSMQAIQKNKDSIRNHGHAIDMHADDITRDLDSYDLMVDQLLGLPVEDMTTAGKVASKNLRKLTALNSLSKLGVAQAGEMGRAMAAVGIKSYFTGIPALAKFITDSATGKIRTDLVKNIEDHVFGVLGDDYFMNHPKIRGEDLGLKSSKFENGLNKLGYFQGKLSGWHLIHTKEKEFLMNGLGQKWYRELTTGEMSKGQKNALGIDARMETKIKANMETHATLVDKTWGKSKVQNLNIHKWDNETAVFFGRMLQRKSANAIQEILIGETPGWMNKELGKVLMQFRTFNAASLAKQTRRDINLLKTGDTEPIRAFQFSLLTAGLATMGKIMWDAGTSGNADDYLKENMTVGHIARQSLIYNGQVGSGVDILDIAGSTLMPDAWNPVMGRQGYQSQGGLSGVIPGVGFVDKTARGLKGAVNLVNPFTDASKSDARAMTGFLPLQNSIIGDIITLPIQE